MDIVKSKYQESSRFAVFNLGFRPFFLGAAIFALFATAIWMANYAFGLKFQPYGLPAVTWHAHEMIYGYSMAVIAGFLLTAVKNWTGQQTLSGSSLALLFLLWATARILPLLGESIPLALIAATDISFMLYLLWAVAYPIFVAKQWAHMGIVAKVLLMLASNMVFYAGALTILDQGIFWGLYSGLYLIVALILTMGRRVIPFFLEKGVDSPVQLKNWKWLDILSLVTFLGFWIAELHTPNGQTAGFLAGLLFVLHALRMVGWYTSGLWRKPLLWVLYLAYGALVAGFGLKAAAVFLGISPFIAVHAFAYGGVGMMTIGMMARISLGHTGRSVFEPPTGLSWVFIVLFAGAVVRVLLPLLDPAHYVFWIGVSQGLWIVSFSIFSFLFLPILVRPRADGQVG